MSLNPRIRQDTNGMWWLDWDADPQAIAYDIITSSGAHRQAGKNAITAKLGTAKPNPLPQIASARPGTYEVAKDPSAPPPPPPPPPAAGTEGQLSTVFVTGSATDALLNSFTDAQWQWARDHWDRIYVYPPYSDRWLGKMPKAWAYQDSYAIYNPSSYADAHPDQILRDAGGNKLFIPWGCKNGTCPQYAADFSNPNWRQHYSDQVKAAASKGYGLYADDVNLDAMKASDGSGTYKQPVVGGKAWQLPDWQREFATFMEKVATDNPSIERVHNALWWAGSDGQNADVQRQIKSCNVFSFERGFNDPNYRKDLSQLTRLFNFIDLIHSWGVAAYHLSYATDTQGAMFNLACALMCSNGHDYVSGPAALMAPSSWWAGYQTNLGAAKGPRTQVSTGVWERPFEHGVVRADGPAGTGTIT
jgi:hypothetical protein